jgi:hypothetical protein
LRKHNIHYVAHDEIPYNMGGGGGDDIYAEVKKLVSSQFPNYLFLSIGYVYGNLKDRWYIHFRFDIEDH